MCTGGIADFLGQGRRIFAQGGVPLRSHVHAFLQASATYLIYLTEQHLSITSSSVPTFKHAACHSSACNKPTSSLYEHCNAALGSLMHAGCQSSVMLAGGRGFQTAGGWLFQHSPCCHRAGCRSAPGPGQALSANGELAS